MGQWGGAEHSPPRFSRQVCGATVEQMTVSLGRNPMEEGISLFSSSCCLLCSFWVDYSVLIRTLVICLRVQSQKSLGDRE